MPKTLTLIPKSHIQPMTSSRSFLRPPPLQTNPVAHPQSFTPPNPLHFHRKKLFPSITSPSANLEPSWIQSDPEDRFGGWSVCRKHEIERKNCVPMSVVGVGVGASVAVLVAAFGYFAFPRKGFKFRLNAPFHSFHEVLMPSVNREVPVKLTESKQVEDNLASETVADDKFDIESELSQPKVNHGSDLRKSIRIIVPVAADPIQEEALHVLKKLKIIDNDAGPNELCTRREYARWFVKANSMLVRYPKYKILPMILIAGSTVTAFDDVSVNDPDFLCIQALGEAGIIFSKLSTANSIDLSDVHNSDGQERFDFNPDSFISRFDLINWKAMLEYSFTEAGQKMLRTKVDLLDLDASTVDASPQLLMDLLAGEKSIIRRVFGNIRRLQPQQPVTKAQAAVALTSGRMAEAIHSELSRLEAENRSRIAEMEEIRSELVQRGEIQRLWEEKFNEQKERGVEVERYLQVALLELEKEKKIREEGLAEYMKEKAALDYEQQILFDLRKEIDGKYDRMSTEKANLFNERQSLEELFADLNDQQDAVVEAKSILEAEKEALRILRYWVEEEAWRIQSRVKILKQATQRWKGSSQTVS